MYAHTLLTYTPIIGICNHASTIFAKATIEDESHLWQQLGYKQLPLASP